FIFFFQAEDGIRDGHVTGVQTCALPIFRQNLRFYGGVYGLRGKALREREDWAIETAGLRGKDDVLTQSLAGGWKQRLALACAVRSEERRVGKECRLRGGG